MFSFDMGFQTHDIQASVISNLSNRERQEKL